MTVLQVLQQADIFYELSNTQIELIASICREEVCAQGDVIFEENTPGNELYVIAGGEVEIRVNPDLTRRNPARQAKTIAVLRRGQSFGEVALVDQGLRSAQALAGAPRTHLIVIPRDKLMLLCDSYPPLGYRLMRNLAADLAMKIRNTDLQVREYLAWMPRAVKMGHPTSDAGSS